jgi:hypothetical protein
MAHKHIQRQFQLGHSTLERWFHECYELENRKVSDRLCPTVLGIDGMSPINGNEAWG